MILFSQFVISISASDDKEAGRSFNSSPFASRNFIPRAFKIPVPHQQLHFRQHRE
jgi:hypothetical protein